MVEQGTRLMIFSLHYAGTEPKRKSTQLFNWKQSGKEKSREALGRDLELYYNQVRGHVSGNSV